MSTQGIPCSSSSATGTMSNMSQWSCTRRSTGQKKEGRFHWLNSREIAELASAGQRPRCSV